MLARYEFIKRRLIESCCWEYLNVMKLEGLLLLQYGNDDHWNNDYDVFVYYRLKFTTSSNENNFIVLHIYRNKGNLRFECGCKSKQMRPFYSKIINMHFRYVFLWLVLELIFFHPQSFCNNWSPSDNVGIYLNSSWANIMTF